MSFGYEKTNSNKDKNHSLSDEDRLIQETFDIIKNLNKDIEKVQVAKQSIKEDISRIDDKLSQAKKENKSSKNNNTEGNLIEEIVANLKLDVVRELMPVLRRLDSKPMQEDIFKEINKIINLEISKLKSELSSNSLKTEKEITTKIIDLEKRIVDVLKRNDKLEVEIRNFEGKESKEIPKQLEKRFQSDLTENSKKIIEMYESSQKEVNAIKKAIANYDSSVSKISDKFDIYKKDLTEKIREKGFDFAAQEKVLNQLEIKFEKILGDLEKKFDEIKGMNQAQEDFIVEKINEIIDNVNSFENRNDTELKQLQIKLEKTFEKLVDVRIKDINKLKDEVLVLFEKDKAQVYGEFQTVKLTVEENVKDVNRLIKKFEDYKSNFDTKLKSDGLDFNTISTRMVALEKTNDSFRKLLTKYEEDLYSKHKEDIKLLEGEIKATIKIIDSKFEDLIRTNSAQEGFLLEKINEVIDTVNSFEDETTDKIKKVQDKIEKSILIDVEKKLSKVEEFKNELASMLDKQVKNLETENNILLKEFNSTRSVVNESLKDINKSLKYFDKLKEDVSDKLSRDRLDQNTFANKLNKFEVKFEELRSSLETINNSMLEDNKIKLDVIAKNFLSIQESLNDKIKSIEMFTDKFEEKSLKKLEGKFDSLTSKNDKLLEGIETKSQKQIDSINQKLVEAKDSFDHNVKLLGVHFEAHEENIVKKVNEIVDLVNQFEIQSNKDMSSFKESVISNLDVYLQNKLSTEISNIKSDLDKKIVNLEKSNEKINLFIKEKSKEDSLSIKDLTKRLDNLKKNIDYVFSDEKVNFDYFKDNIKSLYKESEGIRNLVDEVSSSLNFKVEGLSKSIKDEVKITLSKQIEKFDLASSKLNENLKSLNSLVLEKTKLVDSSLVANNKTLKDEVKNMLTTQDEKFNLSNAKTNENLKALNALVVEKGKALDEAVLTTNKNVIALEKANQIYVNSIKSDLENSLDARAQAILGLIKSDIEILEGSISSVEQTFVEKINELIETTNLHEDKLVELENSFEKKISNELDIRFGSNSKFIESEMSKFNTVVQAKLEKLKDDIEKYDSKNFLRNKDFEVRIANYSREASDSLSQKMGEVNKIVSDIEKKTGAHEKLLTEHVNKVAANFDIFEKTQSDKLSRKVEKLVDLKLKETEKLKNTLVKQIEKESSGLQKVKDEIVKIFDRETQKVEDTLAKLSVKSEKEFNSKFENLKSEVETIIANAQSNAISKITSEHEEIEAQFNAFKGIVERNTSDIHSLSKSIGDMNFRISKDLVDKIEKLEKDALVVTNLAHRLESEVYNENDKLVKEMKSSFEKNVKETEKKISDITKINETQKKVIFDKINTMIDTINSYEGKYLEDSKKLEEKLVKNMNKQIDSKLKEADKLKELIFKQVEKENKALGNVKTEVKNIFLEETKKLEELMAKQTLKNNEFQNKLNIGTAQIKRNISEELESKFVETKNSFAKEFQGELSEFDKELKSKEKEYINKLIAIENDKNSLLTEVSILKQELASQIEQSKIETNTLEKKKREIDQYLDAMVDARKDEMIEYTKELRKKLDSLVDKHDETFKKHEDTFRTTFVTKINKLHDTMTKKLESIDKRFVEKNFKEFKEIIKEKEKELFLLEQTLSSKAEELDEKMKSIEAKASNYYSNLDGQTNILNEKIEGRLTNLEKKLNKRFLDFDQDFTNFKTIVVDEVEDIVRDLQTKIDSGNSRNSRLNGGSKTMSSVIQNMVEYEKNLFKLVQSLKNRGLKDDVIKEALVNKGHPLIYINMVLDSFDRLVLDFKRD